MIFHKQLISTIGNHFQRDRKKIKMLLFKVNFWTSKNYYGETVSDMDIELEQKSNKIQFLEDEIGKPDSNVVEEMNRLD